MKAVVYHADAHFAWGGSVGDLYKRLFSKFVAQCHAHDIPVVHLTLDGHPGWGDETIRYPQLVPANVMLNREECFSAFLESAPDDVYWFCEPDYEIVKMWPKLTTDCAMLYRDGDSVPMNPAWRMARPKALPFFLKLRDTYRALTPTRGVGFDWHGDSWAFTKVWKNMGSPKGYGLVKYLGVEIEFRDYADYIKPKCKFGRNHFGAKKERWLGEAG